jgi:hypothetical protein
MIGQKSFDIDAKDFIKGMSSSAYIADGGFANTTGAINPIAQPGVIYGPGPITDKSANLAGEIIASCEDPDGSNNRYFVSAPTSAGNGKYFTWNGTTLALAQTDSTNSYNRDSLMGTTDMVPFKTDVFVTLQNEIVKLTNNFAAIDATWWTVTQGKTLASGHRHPQIVYEDGLYIANGNALAFWDGTTSVQSRFSTVNTDDSITALGIDPGSGKMLLAVCSGQNASDTLNLPNRVILYDGVNNKALRVIPVEDMITSFRNVSGTLYVTYGQNLGYWTGSGIKWLRKLAVDLDNTQLAYPHHVTNIGQTLYVVEKNKILAHGQIVAGAAKVFYYALQSPSGNFGIVANIGSNVLGLGYTVAKFVNFDVTSVSDIVAGGTSITTNRYRFERPVTFNSVQVQSTASIPASAGTLNYLDDRGNATALGSLGANPGDPTLNTLPYPTIETRQIILQLVLNSGVANPIGIQRFTVFYTPKS